MNNETLFLWKTPGRGIGCAFFRRIRQPGPAFCAFSVLPPAFLPGPVFSRRSPQKPAVSVYFIKNLSPPWDKTRNKLPKDKR
jgi:hypothetical protein